MPTRNINTTKASTSTVSSSGVQSGTYNPSSNGTVIGNETVKVYKNGTTSSSS